MFLIKKLQTKFTREKKKIHWYQIKKIHWYRIKNSNSLIPSAALAGSSVFQNLQMLGHHQVHPTNMQNVVMLNNCLSPIRS